MIKFGPSGNSAAFTEAGKTKSEESALWVKELGLNCFEYSFGRGVNMSDERALSIGKAFFDAGVEIKQQEVLSTNSVFTNKTVVLTGTLNNYTRPDLTKLLLAMGANVTSSVSKKTDIVIVGTDAGSKLDKAKELNIRIVEEAELLKILNV